MYLMRFMGNVIKLAVGTGIKKEQTMSALQIEAINLLRYEKNSPFITSFRHKIQNLVTD